MCMHSCGQFFSSKVSESLGDLGVSVEVSRLLAECLWVRREEIRLQLIRDSCTFSHSHLVDFDWRLKVRRLSPPPPLS